MVRTGRKPISNQWETKLGNNEIAFAFEMLQEGIRVKLICLALGVNEWTLYKVLRKVKKSGMRPDD
jgi:DNA invertase Pin-like site-specific DNA recombinase